MKRLTKGFLSFIMMTSYLVRFMKGGKVSGAAKLLCNE